MNPISLLYAIPHKTIIGTVGSAAVFGLWIGGVIDDDARNAAWTLTGGMAGVGVAHKLDKIKGMAPVLAGLLFAGALMLSPGSAMAEEPVAACGDGECGLYFFNVSWPEPGLTVGDPTGFVAFHFNAGFESAGLGADVRYLGGLCLLPKIGDSVFCNAGDEETP